MRNKLYILCLALIALVFICSVYSKEKLLAKGSVFYLDLAPRDPRSIMQGDYMRLNYSVNADLRGLEIKNRNMPVNTKILLTKNEKGVAESPKIYNGGKVLENQIIVNLVHFNDWPPYSVAPASFMFQEGKAKDYERARYALLKTDGKGSVLLVALTDDKFEIIK